MRRRYYTVVALIAIVFLSTSAIADTRAPAPPLKARDLGGDVVDLAALKGNVVVVSFWATWCAPCKMELNALNKVLKKKHGLRVIAVSIDGPETASLIRTTVRQRRWTMPVIHDDDGNIASIYNPKGTIPYIVFIDKRGNIAYSQYGFTNGDAKKHETRINVLLTEGK